MKKTILLFTSILCLSLLFSCDIPFLDNVWGNYDGDTTPPKNYTVTFDSNGGTTVSPTTVQPGKTVDKPYDPIRKAANFAGWSYGDKIWNFKNNKVNQDITLTARWDFIEYVISYDLSGGTVSSDLPDSYTIETDTIILTDATKEGCKFAGWYLDGKLIASSKICAEQSVGQITEKLSLWDKIVLFFENLFYKY